MKRTNILQLTSSTCLVFLCLAGCAQSAGNNQSMNTAGSANTVSNHTEVTTGSTNSSNTTVVTGQDGEQSATVIAPVHYEQSQANQIKTYAKLVGLQNPVVPALNVQGESISHIQAGRGMMTLSYPHMMVMESPSALQTKSTSPESGAVVALTNGSAGRWQTLASGSTAFTFKAGGATYVSIVPVHQESPVDKESFQTIADSFRPVGDLIHQVVGEDTLTLENIQVTEQALVITTTKGHLTTAYHDPHIANGQFIVTLLNTRPGKFDVNQTTTLKSGWAKNMRITQQGADLVLTFDLLPTIGTFATSIGAGEMLAFTFQ